ncbi:MAG: hypothetical protein ABI725_04940 [Chloroflexota bacterium]
MTRPRETDAPQTAGTRQVSRLPVIVLVVGMGLAAALVLIGANLAAQPVASPPIGEPGTAAQPRAVTVIMREYHFDPTPLYLFRGETIRLTVVNAGMLEHELVLGDESVQSQWAILDAAASSGAPFATAPPPSAPAGIGGLRIVLPSGGSTSALYEVPAQGNVLLLCNLPGHQERGMVGEVVLQSR